MMFAFYRVIHSTTISIVDTERLNAGEGTSQLDY